VAVDRYDQPQGLIYSAGVAHLATVLLLRRCDVHLGADERQSRGRNHLCVGVELYDLFKHPSFGDPGALPVPYTAPLWTIAPEEQAYILLFVASGMISFLILTRTVFVLAGAGCRGQSRYVGFRTL
jgi:peptidoglycan/LPS O-acetylase OafA/YrhL